VRVDAVDGEQITESGAALDGGRQVRIAGSGRGQGSLAEAIAGCCP
jgi:hypothetical protein